MQERLKEQVKSWLREQQHPRDWLAKRCGVTKRTVDNWLSSPQAIPEKAVLIIERLMIGEELEVNEVEPIPLIVRVNEDRFEAYNRASLREGMTIREWMISTLDDAAANDDATAPRDPLTDYADPAEMAKAVQKEHAEGEVSRKTRRSNAE